jgi:solute carrier family 35 protein F5
VDDTVDDPLVADQGHPYTIPAPLIGDILALLGAIFYGCYTTLLKLKIGSEDRIDMPLFFGFVGAFNVLLLGPAIPILHYLGLETFEVPMNATLWIVILLNAFIGTFL